MRETYVLSRAGSWDITQREGEEKVGKLQDVRLSFSPFLILEPV